MINPLKIDMRDAPAPAFPVGQPVLFRCAAEDGPWKIEAHIASESYGRKFWRYKVRRHNETIDKVSEDSLIGCIIYPNEKRQLFRRVA